MRWSCWLARDGCIRASCLQSCGSQLADKRALSSAQNGEDAPASTGPDRRPKQVLILSGTASACCWSAGVAVLVEVSGPEV
jgi:hypothetical protein